MRVVVIGATGNVGTAVLRRLAKQPEVTSITGIARRRPDTIAEPYNGAEWLSIDIGDTDAREKLTDAMRGADAVIHLAWILQSNRQERLLRRTNVVGTRNVLSAARDAGVPHVVYASSVGAYSAGPKARRVDESWPTGGIHTSHYSRHKAVVERILDRFESENPSIVVTRMRPGLVFQRDAGREIPDYFLGPLIPISILRAVRPPVIPLSSRVVTQAVHADDLAEAYWLAVQRRAGGAFNIAAEPVLDPAAIASAFGAGSVVPIPFAVLRALVSVSWWLHIQRTDAGWLDIAAFSPLMSTDRARDVLGWTPRISSTEAMAELVDGMGERVGLPASPPLWPS